MRKKVKIMIVEDEFITRADIRDKLIHLGYDVAGLASSGKEAIQLADEIKPDLILMDITLDGAMNGIEAAKQIHTFHSIPIIYLTAHSDEKTVSEAKGTDPFGYLIKPFDERMLRILIEISLTRNSWEQQLKASEERYRSIAELSDNQICIFNADVSFSYLNKAASEFFAHPPEEVSGKKLEDLCPPEIAGVIEEQVRTVFTTGVRQRIMNFFTLEGHDTWLDTTYIPIFSTENQIAQVIGVSRDITIQKLIEKDMEQHGIVMIEKNMEQFQILNDQIRNPLQTITLMASLEETQYTEKILENVGVIDDVIKELDRGWLESTKVRTFLLKHYQHGESL